MEMTLLERQASICEKLAILPDPQERLAALVNRSPRVKTLTEGERSDAALVSGCVSRVWVIGEITDGRIHLCMDAEAHLVKGLAAFLCELYDGADATEAAAFEPDALERLGIARLLSPTRLQGLSSVCRRIRTLAAG
jgi:cysteine desulfuration protein SufE